MKRALLQQWGHAVELATDLLRPLQRAEQIQPEVVPVDIGLPGMDGHELARCPQANPRTRDALLVALTGYGQPNDRERALASGFAHHLAKPVPADALRQVLDQARPRPSGPR